MEASDNRDMNASQFSTPREVVEYAQQRAAVDPRFNVHRFIDQVSPLVIQNAQDESARTAAARAAQQRQDRADRLEEEANTISALRELRDFADSAQDFEQFQRGVLRALIAHFDVSPVFSDDFQQTLRLGQIVRVGEPRARGLFDLWVIAGFTRTGAVRIENRAHRFFDRSACLGCEYVPREQLHPPVI